jgi:putative membrane-bound dehydrogenase-like protein
MKKAILIVGISLLAACEASRNERNFSTLTEEERRLPENALSSMQVANGLEVALFAAEPMVINPTNISVDGQGRVWVCEAPNYDVAPDKADSLGNRIIVLEDTDHDGKADKRTVFYQDPDLHLPLGVTVLGDKIYVTSSPQVFIFTDHNGDLVPEDKQVLFTNMHKGEHSTHSLLPGPDGMIYFSLGNYTRDIQDKNQNPIIDKAGLKLFEKGSPYLGGMVLRSSPDGKNVEVLGHNFRNNYEPCIDSYGNVWQSDNDDDGNESSRINFVMYHGNYGFLDEKSSASWTTSRINIEKTVSERHWHQNDPGVVPNVLITGAGSPAGMTYYEGELLPEVFQLVPIHAEPYYNVVRAYLPARKGAGYTLEIEDVVKSQDKWFRPIDVATAPDGSLFIADWYDPILGGGAAADAKQGRIYRVARSAKKYTVPASDISTIEGSIAGLKNPNPEARYAAFQHLADAGTKANDELKELWKSNNPVYRARALWLLAKSDGKGDFLRDALDDSNVDIRIAAVRAVALNKQDVVPYLRPLSQDENAAVRREVAVALRYSDTQAAAELWVDLARKYDGKDRWYLEALGIGADLHSDLFFNTWFQNTDLDLENKAHQDLIWRSRSSKALPLLADLIKNTEDEESYLRYFRAFDFHDTTYKTTVLTSLIGLPREDQMEINTLALQQINARDVVMTSSIRKALDIVLNEKKGTLTFINLVEKFGLKERQSELVEMATSPGGETASAATELLLKFDAIDMMKPLLHKNDSASITLLESMRGKGNSKILNLIAPVVTDKTLSAAIRKTAVQVLGSSWPGEERLLSLVKEPEFDNALKPAAGAILFNVYRSKIQREAAEYLPRPSIKGITLPPIKQLLASAGNVKNGQTLFERYCMTCHKVKNEGADFGPELSVIGEKLSREGLYRSILYPNEGVSFGYETTFIKLNDGTESMGIIVSETPGEITVNFPGGSSANYTKSAVSKTERQETSLMPELAGAMSEQDLVDLVEYLASLKKR